jgi:hypothetical protein
MSDDTLLTFSLPAVCRKRVSAAFAYAHQAIARSAKSGLRKKPDISAV